MLLFANLRQNKKACRPIFPVLICVIRAVSGFLIPLCSCRTLVPGVGARARSSFPFDSAAHDSAHLLSVCCLCTALIAALKGHEGLVIRRRVMPCHVGIHSRARLIRTFHSRWPIFAKRRSPATALFFMLL